MTDVNEAVSARSVPEIAVRQAHRIPEATALIDERRRLTFQDWNDAANRLAHYLLHEGIRPGEAVGVAVSRSIDMAVTVLAILKVGACYVPLNRNFPAALINAILITSKIRRVIASADYPIGIIAPSVLRAYDEIPAQRYPSVEVQHTCRGGDLAWVLYTSGSTGVPKGVMGTHDNILSRCRQIWQEHPYQPGEVAIQNTRLSVIDSIWELWAPAAQGVPVVLLDEQKCGELRYLIDAWQAHGISRICLVPSLLNEIVDAFPDLETRLSPRLAQWITSGEILTARTVRRFYRALPDAVLYNQYGLTESSADVTTYDTRRLSPLASDDEVVPVGRMFDQVEAMLLDPHGEPVAPEARGERGELCLSGPCLSVGYASKQDNQGRFFTRAVNGAPTRWLRTGDLAHWDPRGDLVVAGRSDRQVKIRGYRVECDGVEATLAQSPAVSEIAVIAKKDRDGSSSLQAFVVLFPGSEVSEVEAFARAQLPEYGVPAHIEAVAAIPRTHSGKLDRSALAKRNVAPPRASRTPLAALTQVERQLMGLWRTVLGGDELDAEDGFFHVGGNSLKLMRLQLEIDRQLGAHIGLADLFAHPTLREQARLVTAAQVPARAQPGEPPGTADDRDASERARFPLSPAQKGMWLHEQAADDSNPYGIVLAGEVSGVVDHARLGRALRTLIRTNPILRVRIYPDEDGLVQEIAADEDAHLEVVSCADATALERKLAELAARRIDVSSEPPLQVAVLICEAQAYSVVVLHVHHTICDGRSMALLVRQLTALLSGDPTPGAADLRYLQHCLAAQTAPELGDASLAYLSATLSELQAIPYDHSAGEDRCFRGKEVALRYASSQIEQIVRALDVPGVTSFTLFMAVYSLCLSRTFDLTAPLIGFTSAAVPDGCSDAIGCYVSVLPVRVGATETSQFRAFVREMSLQVWNAIERCTPSFEALLPVLRDRKIAVDFRGFQTIVAYDNNIIEELEIAGLPVLPRHVHTRSSKFDLSLNIEVGRHFFDVYFEFNDALFFAETIEALRASFDSMLEAISGNPHATTQGLLTMAIRAN